MGILENLQEHQRKLFYGLWLLVSLIQAAGTGLFDDEAYYWVYSKYPDWGYFDHPPMIALLIKTGYSIFQNELGVRLLIVLMSVATIATIDSLTEKKNDKLFYAIILSMFLLQIGSIIAVPDVPLLFFIALFFLSYKKFITNFSAFNALLLGVITALMLYSKYHGVLIIICTLLSNIELFKKPTTYLAGVVAIGLFLPHLLWQYQHDFISVQYHLFERNATDYQLSFTTEYIFGQILLAGPLIGWLLLWAAGKHKPANKTEKALQWTFFGVYGLFFISTFKGRSEANWTVPALVSLIVLAHQYLNNHPIQSKWVMKLLLPSLVIVLAVRVYMLLDIAPLKFLKKDEFHKNKEWAAAVKNAAGDMPVAFINSYQRASKYWFYSGEPGFSVNNVYYRRNNFNFWPLEAPLQDKKVLVVSPIFFGLFPDSIGNPKQPTWARIADPYFSYSQVRIYSPSLLKAPGSRLQTTLNVIIPESLLQSESFAKFDTAHVGLTIYFHDSDPGMMLQTPLTLRDLVNDKKQVDFRLPGALAKGRYRARWSINSCLPGLPTLNSSSYAVEVE
jgi:hypothetical protein